MSLMHDANIKIMSFIGFAKLVNNSEGSSRNKWIIQFISVLYTGLIARAKNAIRTNVRVQNTPQFHKASKN